MEYLSTSALANSFNMKVADLFEQLNTLGWITRKEDKWQLSALGKQKGGETRFNPKYGEYIVWPENTIIDEVTTKNSTWLNATAIAKHFELSSQRLNLVFSELGWIEKKISGWTITQLGKNVGGKQFEHEGSGSSYVLWPQNILSNKSLVDVFEDQKQDIATIDITLDKNHLKKQISSNDFREKFEAKHRTKDGHYVRSKAEVIIDNTLYDYGLVHAYEKKVPIEEELYTDFYLPNGKIYIEYWGLENEPKYAERKKAKLAIYKKYDLKLIELDEKDISNLDDHLPKKLLKFGIKVY